MPKKRKYWLQKFRFSVKILFACHSYNYLPAVPFFSYYNQPERERERGETDRQTDRQTETVRRRMGRRGVCVVGGGGGGSGVKETKRVFIVTLYDASLLQNL